MPRQARNLNQVLLAAMDRYAERPCFWTKRAGQFEATTYQHFQRMSLRLASFFRSQGLAPGDRVAVIADNSVEWLVVYVACLLVSGVIVPLRHFLPPKTLHFRLKNAGACLAVIQGTEQDHVIAEAGEGLPDLKTILVIDQQDHLAGIRPEVISLGHVLSQSLASEEAKLIRTLAEAIKPETLAAIHYSGSETGRPRGALFTHAQRLAGLQAMAEWFDLSTDDLAFTTPLPFSYPANLEATLHYFVSGVANALAESSQTSFEDLQQISPTVTLTTPQAFQYIYQAVIAKLAQLPEAHQELFQWALAIGKAYQAAGSTASAELREEYIRADLTFFSQIRGMLGGRLRRFYSAGAPLSQPEEDFARIIGLTPLNIYSLTEAGGFPAVSRPDAAQPSSCGRAAPGFQIRIAADHEVLIRGPSVTRGYWRPSAEPLPALDADGWLHSGDLGYLDKEGYLYLTGHKQAALVLSTGRKIIPAAIESTLTAHPFVAQAVIFGEGRLYVSALLVPDLAAITAHLRRQAQGDGDQAGSEFWSNVAILMVEVVQTTNSQLDGWEQIEQYTLLDHPFSQERGELTASNKINRQVIAERYAPQIEAMYPPTIQFAKRAITHIQLAPERLRELLEKENIMDAWLADAGIGFLFELARRKQIETSVMVHICDAAAMIAQMRQEGKALSTAFIIGDPARIARILPVSDIQLRHYNHIRRMRHVVVTLARVVDGLLLGYAIDRYGYLRGIHKLNIALDEPANFLLGPQFRRHAAISQQCEAVVFFTPTGGRQVRIFADGQLVGRYAHGNWVAESIPRLNETITRLAHQHGYDLSLLQRLLRCAFQMSEENLGAIFIVGNPDMIMKRADPPEITPFAAILEANLADLSDQELINFAKQDGATVIDTQGRFRGCMVLLRPSAETQADIGPGQGARHSSAAKMSAEALCLALVVSQDGPITLYHHGQRVLSL
jgi:long-chain acyl-CoA synthetase